jgi:hypothetical protein
VGLDHSHADELLAFRQFRRNILGFLRLPLDVSESALRDALNTISPHLLASYKQRAAQATLAWAAMCRTDLQSLRLRGEAQARQPVPRQSTPVPSPAQFAPV